MWGAMLTITTFILITVHTLKHKWMNRKQSLLVQTETDRSISRGNYISNGLLWKVCVLCYSIALIAEIIITIVFWSVLYKDVA
mmetsp:Transcript_6063/g.7024  ORF Transcript_6063/g.7024 Transcript_6063/m.7024 type:complete len:83 (-) Transcript_6063:206-454(-)